MFLPDLFVGCAVTKLSARAPWLLYRRPMVRSVRSAHNVMFDNSATLAGWRHHDSSFCSSHAARMAISKLLMLSSCSSSGCTGNARGANARPLPLALRPLMLLMRPSATPLATNVLLRILLPATSLPPLLLPIVAGCCLPTFLGRMQPCRTQSGIGSQTQPIESKLLTDCQVQPVAFRRDVGLSCFYLIVGQVASGRTRVELLHKKEPVVVINSHSA